MGGNFMRLADGTYVDNRLYEMIVSEQFEMFQLNPGEIMVQSYQSPLASPEVGDVWLHVAAIRIDNFLGVVNYRQEGKPLPEVIETHRIVPEQVEVFFHNGKQLPPGVMVESVQVGGLEFVVDYEAVRFVYPYPDGVHDFKTK
jgi:hypothetical protein